MRHSSRVIELMTWLLLMVAPAEAPCLILDAIDSNRAIAFAQQDQTALAALYETPEAAHADTALLQDYREREIRITDMQVERESCVVNGTSEIEVVERLAVTRVKFAGGTARDLPAGEWKQRRIALVYDGWWRIRSTTEIAG